MPPKAKATLLHEELTALKAQRAWKRKQPRRPRQLRSCSSVANACWRLDSGFCFTCRGNPMDSVHVLNLFHGCFSWQEQHFEHVIVVFPGRCSTLSTSWFFFVAGAALWPRYDFFSWQVQHFEHVMLFFRGRCSIWARYVVFFVAGTALWARYGTKLGSRCGAVLNRNVVLAKKKLYIYIFFKPRAPRYDRGFPCGAVAIFDRNVVSRCGAGCILKPGVRARVARWPFWIVTWCFVVAPAAFWSMVCVCVWRGGHFG